MRKRILLLCCLLMATVNATSIATDKAIYDHGNGDTKIEVNFVEMEGTATDWIGIYPSGASYEFENVVAWKLSNGEINGSVEFDLLNAGNYDVRAFFNNTLTKEAELSFQIVGVAPIIPDVNLTTDKTTYLDTETITVTFAEMQGNVSDWIGIYPAGASYEFENVVDWVSTNGEINGSITFESPSIGLYEVRAFFNNTLTKEATRSFSVTDDPNHHDVNLTTAKTSYLNTETIEVNFKYMQGNVSDWIGVYPAGSSYESENIVAYKQTNGDINGSVSFSNLAIGNYDVRAFFNNSLTQEATTTIEVITDPNYHEVNLTLNKNIYAQNELIYVNYNYMQGNATDWIGIYPAGSSYHFFNVIDWKSTGGNVQGELALGGFPANTVLHGSTPMPGLAPGNYEIRAFFNNSLHQEKVATFTVVSTPVVSMVYEEVKDGNISKNWIHVSGDYSPEAYIKVGSHIEVVRLRAQWGPGVINASEYTLPFDAVNTMQKVLELDVGGVGRWTPHFNIGVIVQTTNGTRRMLWDSYLNHYNVSANKQGIVLSFPTYVELQQNNGAMRTHFRVNVDKYLKILEPDNKIVSISAFFATGGDLDNIKLSSH